MLMMLASGVLLAVAGDAADAHDAGLGGCFRQWPALQRMLMMLHSEEAFGSGWPCS